MMDLEYRYYLNSQLGLEELTHNPVGWDAAENILKRSDKFKGVFNNYSLNSLEFTGNGEQYLIELEALEGINMYCEVIVEKLNYNTKLYESIYTGILNGKTYNETDKYGGCVEMKIGESEVNEKILARSKVDINYDDDIGIDGKSLSVFTNKYVRLSIIGNEVITGGSVEFEEGDFYAGSVGSQPNIVAIPSVYIESNNPNAYSPDFIGLVHVEKIGQGGWWYETDRKTAKVNIKLNASIRCYVDEGMRMLFAVGDKLKVSEKGDDPDYLENITIIKQITVPYIPLPTSPYTQIDEDFDVEMDQNQALFLCCISVKSDPNVAVGYIMSDNSGSIEISELPITTGVNAIRPDRLFRRIIESITGINGITSSSLLDYGKAYNGLLAFNGYMARGYDVEDAIFTTNLEDFFDSYGIACNAGLKIDEVDSEPVVSIESLDDFYLNDVCLTIDNVENGTWERSLDPNLHFTSCVAGYDKTEYEEDSGLVEYNNKSSFATEISKTDGVLSLIPKYRFDGYGVTFAIDSPVASTETTDTKYDKSIFVVDSYYFYNSIWIQKGRSDFSIVEGIDKITQPINLNFSPLRLLLRNSEQLTTGFEKIQATKIKFTSSEVKNNLGTRKDGESFTYVENADVPVGNLKDARFTGFLLKFAYAITFEVFAFLKAHRYEKIEVKNPKTGKYHYGWIMSLEMTLDKKVSVILAEQNNGYNPETQAVMVDHNADFIVTDKNFKISVNE